MKTGFYNLNKLSKEELKQFFKEANELSYDSHVDKLDVNISWARQRTDEKSVEEMIEECDPSYHNVCIDRSIQYDIERQGEIGYSIISDKYFLYIFVTLENLKVLINKFKLEMQ